MIENHLAYRLYGISRNMAERLTVNQYSRHQDPKVLRETLLHPFSTDADAAVKPE
jgi:hypothetical protein